MIKSPLLQSPFVRYQLPFILWALVIFTFSSFPTPPVPRLGIRFEDKWQHLVAYGLLGYLAGRAFFFQNRYFFLSRRPILMAVLFGVLYGISDEFHQYFVPGRFTDIYDVIADGIGALLGAGLFALLGKGRPGVGDP